MCDFPQFGIKLPPYVVGGMVPRPAHIQGKFRQGIEPLDFGGQKVVDRVADAGSFAHRFSLKFLRLRSRSSAPPLTRTRLRRSRRCRRRHEFRYFESVAYEFLCVGASRPNHLEQDRVVTVSASLVLSPPPKHR